ncbi:MAG: DUF4331 domain-containing protein [Chloroflexi bacterium]|nr:DUF4331 domain-containing protein [Chloroflexota bacterium]
MSRLGRIPSRLVLAVSLALIFVGVLLWTVPLVGASSHREAPLISKDPAVDNTDLYAFRSPDDASMITLISNWIPFEEPAGGPNFYHFDDNARYLIKVDRDGDAVEDVTYEWVFHTEIQNPATFLYNTGPINNITDTTYNYRQYYTVTEYINGGPTTVLGADLLMPPDNIGPRSTPNYPVLSAQAIRTLTFGIREFTGQRDDPFFVDVGAIFDLGGLRPFNSAHLIPLHNAPGQDNVHGFNIHTTAIQVPRSHLVPSCSGNPADKNCVVGVWTTAERRAQTVRGAGTETGAGGWVQVSRLGNPLVNEVVIDLARKDIFNAIPPTADAAALDRVLTPELGSLIQVLYPGVTVPPPPRNDLVTVFLTGIPGLNQQLSSTVTPSEQLRLNTAITPTAGVCAGNPLGVLGNDVAGYPNGRRLEDDVVDIALRAVAGGYVLTPSFNHSPNNVLGDGVNQNDKPCLANFPYMAPSWGGYDSLHSLIGSSSPPVVPELTPLLMFGSGLAGLGGYALARLRSGRARKREDEAVAEDEVVA